MDQRQSDRNRRKFDRFSPTDDFFVYLRAGQRFILGRLVDIGLGGVSFECLSEISERELAELTRSSCDLGIFVSSQQFFLSGVRSSVIYARELEKQHSSFLGICFKRCGLRFEELEPGQEDALVRFLQKTDLKRLD
jgi:c-di-GMP-binding flagellar brake protein YcgR